ncbi:MAG: flippase [Minisyncoccia bacterium]|jgi:O-antigen/teichoic acid export membrane protein
MKVNLGKIKSLLFENTSLKQTVLKNTFWLTAGTTVSRLIRAVLIIYAARVLGTEGYGIVSYALSLAAFFGILTDIGLSPLLTRETIKNPDKVSAYLSTTFFLKLVFTALATILMIAIYPLVSRAVDIGPLLPFVVLLLIFDNLRTFGFSITRARNKMEWEAGLGIATDVFITALGIISLLVAPHPKELAEAYTAGTIIGFCLVFFILRKQFKGILTNFDRKLVKPIITKAWPFAIIGLLGGFMINIDTVIIGIFRSAGEIGLYAAAQRPVQLLYLFPSLFAASVFPIFSRLVHENRHEAAKKVIETSITAVIAVALPITIGGIIAGQPLVGLIFGPEYLDATLTFQLLLITTLLVFPGTVIGNLIFAYDKQKIFILSTSVGALANTGLDLIFIPIYGIAGSAVATIIAQILVNIINWTYLKKIQPFSIWPHLSRTILATVLMGAATFSLLLLGLNIVLNVLVSGLIFAGVLYATKEPILGHLGVRRSILG